MAEAARAIIIKDGKILVMHRNKYGSQYFTLVGGRVNDAETIEEGLVREVKEETGLDVIKAQLVFIEDHPEPYNKQFIFLCEVAPNDKIAIQDDSEEGAMNRMDMNVHQPMWAQASSFAGLQFRTPQLHAAILEAMKKGFPKEPVKL